MTKLSSRGHKLRSTLKDHGFEPVPGTARREYAHKNGYKAKIYHSSPKGVGVRIFHPSNKEKPTLQSHSFHALRTHLKGLRIIAAAETAAALGHERYNWHTFQGKRGVTLHHKGQPHTKLQAGMRYGMRHSNDGKSIHLITEHNGKNIVHKISHDHSERLADRSKPLRAGTKIKDPHNHAEVKPKKPATEEHPAPKAASKPVDHHAEMERGAKKHARNLHRQLGIEGHPINHHTGMANGGHSFPTAEHMPDIRKHLEKKGWIRKSSENGKKSTIHRYEHPSGHMAEVRETKNKHQFHGVTVY